MPRYKLTIGYDGTAFCGWQKQFPHADAVPNALKLQADDEQTEAPAPKVEAEDGASERPRAELRTVQSVMERALRVLLRQPVHIQGASRTDSGVHANGQVAAFNALDAGGREGGWPASRGTVSLCRALNSRLPDDILVRSAAIVDPEFDPINDAINKCYTYTMWTGHDRPLWDRTRMLHIWQPLDAGAMHEAAQVLVGEHDFAAFATAGHGRKTTVRTVYSCDVVRQSPERIVMSITGSGFLWNMVRIIAGTLVEAGKGKMSTQAIRSGLESLDRSKVGPTLPPHGLCLEWIKYAEAGAQSATPDAPRDDE